MNILNYNQYQEYKLSFIRKHNNDFVVTTSNMNELGEYHKMYIFADGAQLVENMRPVYEKTEVTIKGVQFSIEVKLLETEAFSSDNSESVYYYEKFNHEKVSEV